MEKRLILRYATASKRMSYLKGKLPKTEMQVVMNTTPNQETF